MTRHSTYDRECGSASRIIGRSIASIAGLWGPPLAGRALSIRRPGASKPYGKRGLGRGLRYIARHKVCIRLVLHALAPSQQTAAPRTAALILDDTRQLSAFCLNRKSSACVCLRQAAISKLATVSVENVSYARSVELVQSYDAWPLRQYAVYLVGVV